MAGFWIHQTNAVPAAEPWEQLGNQEQLGAPIPCPQLMGGPPYLSYFQHQALRRYPLHRSPVGSPSVDAKLQLIVSEDLMCYTDATTSRGEIVDIVPADRIAPIEPAPGETEHDPPWIIPLGKLFKTDFTGGPNVWPSVDWDLNYQWYCGPPSGPMDTRLLWPILRVVNRVGWWLELHITGSVPKCVYNSVIQDFEIFRLRFGMNDVQSWDHAIYEINEPQDLWLFFADQDICNTQMVNFYVWIPVYFCDQVIDMWVPNAAADYYFPTAAGYEPIAAAFVEHGAFSLSVVGARLLPPV